MIIVRILVCFNHLLLLSVSVLCMYSYIYIYIYIYIKKKKKNQQTDLFLQQDVPYSFIYKGAPCTLTISSVYNELITEWSKGHGEGTY